ncbi:uncharacterized protein LOC141679276 [Apium graveolens]|uniref:uncharacterized protein LOC141679276 n=1 Tax=Apium graveolens TaxID=4045 RepID=UPI003D7A347C
MEYIEDEKPALLMANHVEENKRMMLLNEKAIAPKLNKELGRNCVYMKQEDGELLVMSVYIDDLLVTGTSVTHIERFKEQMSSIFEMSNLGIEVDYGKRVYRAQIVEICKEDTGAGWNVTVQKQRCVALSPYEAEFMAANATACQGIWLRNVFGQILRVKMSPVVLYVDNKSTIDLSKNLIFYGHSKHMDIRYHFIRDCVEKGEIVIKYVTSDIQRADILTKALTTVKCEQMRQLMGVKNSMYLFKIKGEIVGY